MSEQTRLETLPQGGRGWNDIERDLGSLQAHDPPLIDGTFDLWWPVLPADLQGVARLAHSAFMHANAFFTTAVPSLERIDAELRAMVADVLRVPASGTVTLTGGGTESNFLAVKGARDWARAHRPGIERPRLVLPLTAHPSFDKAADVMDLAVTRVGVRPDWRADPAQIAAALDDDVILVAGSVPQYAHGVVDPIGELASVAAERGIWMHVDACVGGFLHRWVDEVGSGLPPFDFAAVPGVWSVSADLHKFGFCPHGISTLSLREAELAEYHTYHAGTVWPTGGYSRRGFTGSRPASPVVAAWAVMQFLGADGYRGIAREIVALQELFVRRLAAIPALEPVVEPELGVLAVASRDADVGIPDVAEALSRRGWHPARIAEPEGLHLLFGPVPVSMLDRYLADLEDAVADARSGRVRSLQREATYVSE
ncbi:pyridoxal phosphate-dependent decarboxylase family protein [Conexibacter woesei]|uniref:Pyridoxal-dependent decarboxylase n=1 Tax=Conexibacter woesei (strain DSM 14684 / CCUG 47730 / CIP 108061 / JCM 11494 / NBRC 100937 / ID131577) TaxID=469383 RepID=D3F7B6_CONWI|nr:aminotransferase class V-fold PLP-dependent enzyme [Conexibacter woesei]ADB48887.1 Pyridoxal-dependent decarboxylase [Conexibacter woesei DSM 14684]